MNRLNYQLLPEEREHALIIRGAFHQLAPGTTIPLMSVPEGYLVEKVGEPDYNFLSGDITCRVRITKKPQ